MMKMAQIIMLSVILVMSISSCTSRQQELSDKVDSLAKVQEYQKAFKLIDEFILSDPSNSFGRGLRTKLLLQQGDARTAFGEYQKYLEIEENHSRELLEQFVSSVDISELDDCVEGLLRLQESEDTELNKILTDIVLSDFQNREVNAKLKTYYIDALEATGDGKAMTFITDLAIDVKEDEEVRIAAINAIRGIGEGESTRDLLPLLEDSSESIRICVAENLFHMGNYDGTGILLSSALNVVQNDLPNQRASRKNEFTYLSQKQNEALSMLGWLAKREDIAKQELLRIVDDMLTSRKWDEPLLSKVVVIITAETFPSEAIESLIKIVDKYPGSFAEVNGVFLRTISRLEHANKTPDQKKEVETALATFVKTNCKARHEARGEGGSIRTAYGSLTRMSPDKARQLKSDLTRSNRQWIGIN